MNAFFLSLIKYRPMPFAGCFRFAAEIRLEQGCLQETLNNLLRLNK